MRPKSLPEAAGCKQNPCRSLASTLTHTDPTLLGEPTPGKPRGDSTPTTESQIISGNVMGAFHCDTQREPWHLL